MKRISALLALTFILFNIALISGCENTVRGFGQDMQQNGQEIQKSASS